MSYLNRIPSIAWLKPLPTFTLAAAVTASNLAANRTEYMTIEGMMVEFQVFAVQILVVTADTHDAS